MVFVGQLAFYGAAAIGWALERRNVQISSCGFPLLLLVVNLAPLLAVRSLWRGRTTAVWEPAAPDTRAGWLLATAPDWPQIGLGGADWTL